MNSTLKLIIAYWCHAVSPVDDSRFYWSYEAIESIVDNGGIRAKETLLLLAETAPSEHCAAYFAAGPLEDYINNNVRTSSSSDASFIRNTNVFKTFLPHVWGKVNELNAISDTKEKSQVFENEDPRVFLKVLNFKDLVSFWCHIRNPQAGEYDAGYENVIKKLLGRKDKHTIIQEMTATAPDEKALVYLQEEIFILHK